MASPGTLCKQASEILDWTEGIPRGLFPAVSSSPLFPTSLSTSSPSLSSPTAAQGTISVSRKPRLLFQQEVRVFPLAATRRKDSQVFPSRILNPANLKPSPFPPLRVTSHSNPFHFFSSSSLRSLSNPQSPSSNVSTKRKGPTEGWPTSSSARVGETCSLHLHSSTCLSIEERRAIPGPFPAHLLILPHSPLLHRRGGGPGGSGSGGAWRGHNPSIMQNFSPRTPSPMMAPPTPNSANGGPNQPGYPNTFAGQSDAAKASVSPPPAVTTLPPADLIVCLFSLPNSNYSWGNFVHQSTDDNRPLLSHKTSVNGMIIIPVA